MNAELRALAYMDKIISGVDEAMRKRQTVMLEDEVFGCGVALEAEYHIEGRYLRGSRMEPDEHPDIVIDAVTLFLGDIRHKPDPNDLPEEIWTRIEQRVREELKCSYF